MTHHHTNDGGAGCEHHRRRFTKALAAAAAVFACLSFVVAAPAQASAYAETTTRGASITMTVAAAAPAVPAVPAVPAAAPTVSRRLLATAVGSGGGTFAVGALTVVLGALALLTARRRSN